MKSSPPWFAAALATLLVVTATMSASSVTDAEAGPGPADLGSLDPSFGEHGLVSLFPACEGCAAADMAVQPDGRILVAANDGIVGEVRRLLLDGSLDPSFGSGGIVRDLPFTRTSLLGVRPLDDGRMILAGVGPRGAASPSLGPAMLTRLLPDGSIDASFGTDGAVTVQPFEGAGFGRTVELEGGDLLAFGYADKRTEPDPGRYALLARFTPEGVPVTAWGDDGIVTFTRLIDGYSGSFLSANAQHVIPSPDGGMLVFDAGLVWRIDPSGVLDGSFGGDGIRSIARGQPVALPDGRFMIAAREFLPSSGFQIRARWYLDDATVDPAFGEGVRFGQPNADDHPEAGALDALGDVLVAGSTTGHGSEDDFLLARLLPDGTFDTSVGIDGLIATDVFDYLDLLTHVAPLPDGRVAVMGLAFHPVTHQRHHIVAVYGPHDLDDEPPVATMTRPSSGTQYGQLGVQAIRGTSSDRLSGVTGTEAALRIHRADGSCAWMGAHGWIDRSCRRPLWHDAGVRFQWAWELPRLLPRSIGSRGRWYTAFARATDAGGNVEHRFVDGRNRVTFEIGLD
jgi:uncharacterized delta-60 repeat protein